MFQCKIITTDYDKKCHVMNNLKHLIPVFFSKKNNLI